VKLPHFHRAEVVVVLVLTVAIWGWCQSLDPVGDAMVAEQYGAVPVRMWAAWHSLREQGLSRDVLLAALPLVTANYLHASLGHVAMNMLFFWIFGNIVSEAVGRVGFLALYLLAGIIAVLVYVKTNPHSEIPMVGASGAIAGLEGAYFVFRWELPHAHVWPLEGPIPPWRFGVVALLNFFLDTQAFFGHARDTTAYGAHVGGFVGGALIAMAIASLWRPKWRRKT
jgi:rhomboid family protein